VRSTRLPSWISRLAGLEAVQSPPFVFSISEGSIRYGNFPRVADGLGFREYHEVALGSDTFGAGVLGPTLREERSLRAGLDELLSRLDAVPSEASLVVPDSWLRLVFAELDDLPRAAREREEVLRWRLKSLVPFKVDELRLRALEVEPRADGSTTRTVLLAFAAESLLRTLEAAFSSYGIRIGRIANVSLSLLEAVWQAGGGDGRLAVVSVSPSSYTIVFVDGRRPLLYRHKPLGEGAETSALDGSVRRELRLTRTFVSRQLGSELDGVRVFLFAPETEEEPWREWLTEELTVREVRTGSQLVPPGGRPASVDAVRVAPMMGAACAMVR
jgi:hypothetical protein